MYKGYEMMNEKYKFNFSKLTVSYNLRLMFVISLQDNIEMTKIIAELAEFDMVGLPAWELPECLESFSRQYTVLMSDSEVELDDIWDEWGDE